MEWVETTGKTIEDAKDAALDQLGVDEQDAEFEVLEEPRAGLFGRTRGEARVRARVQPTQPRPKVERREHRGRADKAKSGGAKGGAKRPPAAAKTAAADEPSSDDEPATGNQIDASAAAVAVKAKPAGGNGGERRPSRGGRGGERRPRAARPDGDDDEGSTEMSETELLEQGEVVKAFLLDLLDAFGLDGEVATATAEDGAVELAVTGPDLGLLIGPKGQTLQAIQELSRSALQRQKPGEAHAKVRIDVSGYRERRREALARFTQDVAEQVKASGERKALEPMSPPDRKVVHDTVNDIEGVTTVSEGEDSRRRVVILPRLTDSPLLEQLERARSLGLLGPGPAVDHLVHAQGFIDALDGIDGRVVDLGSGGGVPGLPVAVAREDLEVVLLDSSVRRCEFLSSAVQALGLGPRVSVVAGRAEDLGRGDLRGAAAVIARSFGAPAVTAECAAPLLRVGGRLIVSEPPDTGDRWPRAGTGLVGLAAVGPPSGSPRIQVLELVAPCPDEYPRRDGVPAKRPLF